MRLPRNQPKFQHVYDSSLEGTLAISINYASHQPHSSIKHVIPLNSGVQKIINIHIKLALSGCKKPNRASLVCTIECVNDARLVILTVRV